MKKNIILLANIFLILSCEGQIKPIGEAIIDLEKFNFNTKISELYPQKNKSKEYKNTYIMKGFNNNEIFVSTDSTFINETKGIEYIQGNSSSLDSIASFSYHIFQKINTISSINGEIKLINGVSHWVKKTEYHNFLELLNNKYGKPEKSLKNQNDKSVFYQWSLNDKIIRFVVTPNNENNELNKMMNKVQQKNTTDTEEARFNCYLYIVNPIYKTDILKQKYFSGDLTFFKEEKLE